MPDRVFPVHPAAEIYPLMIGDDFDRLVASIKKNGLRHPIVLLSGAILDGRNRLAACREAGVEPVFRDFDGSSPVDYVVDCNDARRHLTSAQRSVAAAKAAPMYAAEGRGAMASGGRAKGRGKVTQPSPQEEKKRSTAKAAKRMGASAEGTKRMAAVVAAAPEVAAVVEAGKSTVADAQRAAKLPEAERAAVVERVTSGEVPTMKEALAAQPATTAPRKDALGRALPDEIAADYDAASARFARAESLATQLVGALGKLHADRWGAANRLRDSVQLVGLEIRKATPTTTCVYCKLRPSLLPDCEACKGRGWIGAGQFQSAIEPLKIGGSDAVVYAGVNGSRELVRAVDVP